MMGHIGITAMGRWFRARRGQAVAVAALGYSLGEAVLPAGTVALAAAVGWRAAWGVAAAALVLVFAPIILWLMNESRRPQGAAQAELATGLGGRHWGRGDVLSHWLFWALVPGLLAPGFIGTAVFFQQVHVSTVKGWPLAAMALGYPVYAGVTVASSLVCGWLSDRFGPVRLLPVYLLPAAAGITLVGAGHGVGSWHGMMALLGVTQGASGTLLGALWPTLYGTRHLGAIRALATSSMVFATALGPAVTGLLIDGGISFPEQVWAFALWCAAASALFGWVAARLGREPG
jgi:MFS family permease